MGSLAAVAALALLYLGAFGPSAADAPPGPTSRPIGYGVAARGGTTPCPFADEATLRACLGRGGQDAVARATLTVDPGLAPLFVASATTLDGAGRLTIAPGQYGLWLRGAGIVIRNVRIRGPGPKATLHPQAHPRADCVGGVYGWQYLGCAVQIYMPGAVRDVWIDHDDFAACGNKCVAGYDNNDGAGRPDRITISNSVFRRSFLPVNFAVSPLEATLPPPGHVTLYGNLFEANFQRQPQAAGGYQLHVFNNYYTGPCTAAAGAGAGPSVTGGGEMLIENNYADPLACGAIANWSFNPARANGGVGGFDRPKGKIRARGDVGMAPETADLLDFKPSYPYALLPASMVKASVLAHAGVER